MSANRASAWGHFLAAVVSVAAFFFVAPVALWSVLWSLVWTVLFGFVLWIGPAWAVGQPRTSGLRLEHEGFACLMFAFFVFVESVPVGWAVAVYVPGYPSVITGLVVMSLALFRSSWLYAEVILVFRMRRRVDRRDVPALVAYLASIQSPEGTPPLALGACGLLLQRARWSDCIETLEAFPPAESQTSDIHERWGMMKFRSHMKLGEFKAARRSLQHTPPFSVELIRTATLWLDAIASRGQAVLNVLDGQDRPEDIGADYENLLRAHALASLNRVDEAREVLGRLNAVDDVLVPKGPASVLARKVGTQS